MKYKKLSKLAIVASASMLLAGCPSDYEYATLKKYQRQAIQEKLERMTAADADFYIRQKMDGLHRYHFETVRSVAEKSDHLVMTRRMPTVDDGLYLDYWAAHDTNGSFIDEYVDYAMLDDHMENDVKSHVEREFLRSQKAINQAERRRNRLEQKSDKLQQRIDELNGLTR